MLQNVWRVLVSEQDGLGGGETVEKYFMDYDDAHDYYAYVKEQYGKPFHLSIVKPPHPYEVRTQIYSSGRRPWRSK